MATSLRQARYDATRAANRLVSWIQYITTDPIPANCATQSGLPTYWPFHQDVVTDLTRAAVRAARVRAAIEGQAQ